ncbi:hypothetical protein [Pedobacter jeongneungensis]|uniref:hypothetical protein n=1 Tax=Pedobacter jeongneungensis TaxID=947309 RepID=UPI00046828DB|nr:hypothetical protein [Pedobacter jeongneungensis]
MNNSLRTPILFITILLLTLTLIYIFNSLLITQEAFYNTFQNQLENETIDEIFDIEVRHLWISYIFIPVWLLLKIFIITLCLQAGLLLNNSKLKFSDTFRIALTAEFIFLIPQLIKLIWFLFFKTDYTLSDIQQFYPLSALNLFKIENLSALFIYPFQTFNVFEILYWILLAGGIKQAMGTDINHGIKVVFSGYIPALVLWIICVMFITVSISPST